MTFDLRKRAKAHTIQGVTFWMLPFNTPLLLRVMDSLREAFGEDLPPMISMFGLSAPITVGLDLPSKNVPAWAVAIQDILDNKRFFVDPASYWREVEQFVPEETFLIWFAAQVATRQDIELLARPELRGGAPTHPDDIDPSEEAEAEAAPNAKGSGKTGEGSSKKRSSRGQSTQPPSSPLPK
jgi:hypothetical protein